ncbi:MAG: acyl-CoA synthetase FdrA [Betaproteobacteria bacterium]
MRYATLLKGNFQDSVTLMVLSRDLSALPSVNLVSVMMGTPANKDVYRETGLWHETLELATPNDLCIVVDCDSDDPAVIESVTEQAKSRLAEIGSANSQAKYPLARSWRRAKQLLPDANLVLISVAGHYAFEPARQALEDNCHVMLFSDNVTIENEIELKTLANKKGLLVMGPDCGTSIIGKVPLAFANRIPAGSIAVVGASGTGIQEITSQIARLGGGITHALGLGGRDLSESVGGVSALTALDYVARDPASRVVAFVSKPPSPRVKDRILQAMEKIGKPVVALFLGERSGGRSRGNVHFAQTLDEAAALAFELSCLDSLLVNLPNVSTKGICGLYCGGTLAAEAALLLGDALGVEADKAHAEGCMLHSGEHRIIDLGDDFYTRGRPHPMIDPSLRNEMIVRLANEDSVGVLLLDIVLGYGGHLDPAGEVAQAVFELRKARGNKAPIVVIATITGTDGDPQDRSGQANKLEEAGVIIVESVRSAILLASKLICVPIQNSGEVPSLLQRTPAIINIGLRGFANELHSNGAKVVHQQWEPGGGGNERMQGLLAQLK